MFVESEALFVVVLPRTKTQKQLVYTAILHATSHFDRKPIRHQTSLIYNEKFDFLLYIPPPPPLLLKPVLAH